MTLASLIVGGLSMPALITLALQVLRTLGIGFGAAAGLEALLPGDQPFLPGRGSIFGGGGLRRRRRRRKALTATDLSTALTLATAISKKAAEVFILQRTRAS